MNSCPIETGHFFRLKQNILYIQKYTEIHQVCMSGISIFHTMLLLKLCSCNTDSLTVTEPSLCKLDLPSWVKSHIFDGSFKTAWVLCPICAESVNITSIRGIKYISELTLEAILNQHQASISGQYQP